MDSVVFNNKRFPIDIFRKGGPLSHYCSQQRLNFRSGKSIFWGGDSSVAADNFVQ